MLTICPHSAPTSWSGLITTRQHLCFFLFLFTVCAVKPEVREIIHFPWVYFAFLLPDFPLTFINTMWFVFTNNANTLAFCIMGPCATQPSKLGRHSSQCKLRLLSVPCRSLRPLSAASFHLCQTTWVPVFRTTPGDHPSSCLALLSEHWGWHGQTSCPWVFSVLTVCLPWFLILRPSQLVL